MKRLLFAALLLLEHAGYTETLVDDRIAATQATLAYFAKEARLPHRLAANRRTCVSDALADQHWSGSLKARMENFQASLESRVLGEDGKIHIQPAQPKTQQQLADAVRDIMWTVREGAGSVTSRAAQDAAFAIISGPPEPPLRSIQSSWLRGGQILDGQEDCVDRLTLSSPEVKDRFAFVAFSQNCGPLCGLQGVLLLEHRQQGWDVIDGRIDAIS